MCVRACVCEGEETTMRVLVCKYSIHQLRFVSCSAVFLHAIDQLRSTRDELRSTRDQRRSTRDQRRSTRDRL